MTTRWLITVPLALCTLLSGCAMPPRQQARCERFAEFNEELLIATVEVAAIAGCVVLAVDGTGGHGGGHFHSGGGHHR